MSLYPFAILEKCGLSLLCTALFCAGTAGGVETANLLPNGGFESGGLSGWETAGNVFVWEGGAPWAHEGSRYAVLNAGSIWDSDMQMRFPSFAILWRTCDLSPWAEIIDSGTATLRTGGFFRKESVDMLQVSIYIDEGQSVSNSKTLWNSSNNYELVAFTNAIPPGSRKIQFRFWAEIQGDPMMPGDMWGYGFCDGLFAHISTDRQPKWTSLLPQADGIALRPADLLLGASYSVLSSTNLAQSAWVSVTNFTADSSAQEVVLRVDGARQRFYKIQVAAPSP